MPSTLQEILDLEQVEVRVFRGRTRPTTSTRTFGGEVAGQALVAAGRTVPQDRPVHSLHSYFLRPGDPSAPILYLVDAARDGRSFTTRRVQAVQHGETIFVLSASFHVREPGLTHQVPTFSVPRPDELPSADDLLDRDDEWAASWFATLSNNFPLEFRFPDLPTAPTHAEERPAVRRIWLRSAQRLPDDPLLHCCAATYASDLFLLGTALPPHAVDPSKGGVQMASLDHAVWFHAPFRADEWLLYDVESPWAGGARALCTGRLFDQAGTLVASVIQEGLIRPIGG